ncbi:unnamed protein product [Lactuca saligna]|uniref:Uncharacterized protein n=1 Tax=Lactuca saligna TaxID=75948 RepID=A0AA36E8L4_LACSI|nr:unnamed protein product [Lactuca saligna]
MKHEGVDFSGGSSLQSGLWGLRRVATAGEGASGGVSRQKAEGKGIWRWRQWGTGKTSPDVEPDSGEAVVSSGEVFVYSGESVAEQVKSLEIPTAPKLTWDFSDEFDGD